MLEKKLAILVDIFGKYKKEGRGQFVFYCPNCDHYKPKLSINLQKGAKCWICDLRFKDISKLIKRYGSFEQYREWQKLDGIKDFSELKYLFEISNDIQQKKEKLELPREFKTLCSKNLFSGGKIAKKYLLNRGVEEKDILLYKVGYATEGYYANRVIIPSFDSEGHLNYYIARSFDGNRRKYIYPQHKKHNDLIVNELYVDFRKTVVLVEGFFDAIKVGLQAIPLLGTELSEESKLFSKILQCNTEIILVLDNDAQEKEVKIAKKLLKYGIKVSKVKIPSEYKDFGEMNKENVKKIIEENTISLTIDRLMCYSLDMV